MNTITHQYAQAVSSLLSFALNHSTHGSKAAARILLNAYNGNDWKMSSYDFLTLDRGKRAAAMIVLHGRCETLREPHELIKDGDRLFSELAKKMDAYKERHDDYDDYDDE